VTSSCSRSDRRCGACGRCRPFFMPASGSLRIARICVSANRAFFIRATRPVYCQ
jgi:hypothetical protein